MNPSSQNNIPLDGLNAADLLKQGLLTDSHTGAFRHLFQAPALSELTPIFPDLELIELIGEGGMGAVYKARQTDLDRLVALKILPEEISGDDAFSAQFTREARALAKLNHPHIVTIYEFGKRRNLHYIIMEYVDGTSLRKIMEKGLINPQEALAIIPQICDALQYAHDRGIVHRDIKPENILLNSEGVVKVADFGLAKLLPTQLAPHSPGASPAPSPGETFLSRDGKVMGTPAYMPPEQRTHPLQVDHRADIYSLGVVFYQMLTGSLPDTPLDSAPGKTDVDVQLDKIVRKAMADNPDHRYQQASIMKTAVETLSLPPNHSIPSSLSLTQKLITTITVILGSSLCGIAGAFIFHTFSRATGIQVIFNLLMAGSFLFFGCFVVNYKKILQTMKKNTPKRYIISLLLVAGVVIVSAGTLEIAQKEPKPLVEIPTKRVPEKKAPPTIPLEFPAETDAAAPSPDPDEKESWELENDKTVAPTVKRVLSWLSLVDQKNAEESFKEVCYISARAVQERQMENFVTLTTKMDSLM